MASVPPLSSKAAELFKKASEAFGSRNYEYSGLLYYSVLLENMECHEARFKLHLSAIKYRETFPMPFAQRLSGWFRCLRFRLRALWNMRKKDWKAAVLTWEEALRILPLSPSLHFKNAKCLEQLGWSEAAIQEYDILRLLQPGATAPLWELGRLFVQHNRWEEAREIYETIHNLQPDDPKVPSELRKIAAVMTIEKGGWSDTGTYRDKIRDERQARLLEQKERLVKSSADIDAAIIALNAERKTRPHDMAILRELAKLHRLQGDLAGAKEILREAVRSAPGDFLLARDLQDVELETLEQEIDRKKAEVLSRPGDPNALQALEALSKEYRAALLKDKQAQVVQYPTNLLLRFELGALYLDAGMVDEAIAEFQQSVKNPSKRLESQKRLGECFKRKRLYDLAVEQLSKAVDAISEMSPLKKDILYELAGVYEEMGRLQEAKREYQKIYSVDIAYKDVAQKIEKKFRG